MSNKSLYSKCLLCGRNLINIGASRRCKSVNKSHVYDSFSRKYNHTYNISILIFYKNYEISINDNEVTINRIKFYVKAKELTKYKLLALISKADKLLLLQ